jgi:hypothetical protein
VRERRRRVAGVGGWKGQRQWKVDAVLPLVVVWHGVLVEWMTPEVVEGKVVHGMSSGSVTVVRIGIVVAIKRCREAVSIGLGMVDENSGLCTACAARISTSPGVGAVNPSIVVVVDVGIDTILVRKNLKDVPPQALGCTTTSTDTPLAHFSAASGDCSSYACSGILAQKLLQSSVEYALARAKAVRAKKTITIMAVSHTGGGWNLIFFAWREPVHTPRTCSGKVGVLPPNMAGESCGGGECGWIVCTFLSALTAYVSSNFLCDERALSAAQAASPGTGRKRAEAL